jgi:hypothetical protein
MQAKAKQAAIRISLTYGFVGAVWILASDRVVDRLLPDATHISHFQTYKGLGFVAVTAALLYGAVRWFLRQRDEEKRAG